MKNADAVLEEALGLTEDERARIADALLRSLEPPADDEVELAWRQEIRRRVSELESGRTEGIPWSRVRADLSEKLGGVPD